MIPSSSLTQGTGGKDGQVPTDLEQATGLERFELLMKLKGEEAFSLEPLEVTRMGTPKEPIMVFSLVSLLSSGTWHLAPGNGLRRLVSLVQGPLGQRY